MEKQTKNTIKEPTVREFIGNMKKMRCDGLKPHIKGYKGRVKLGFD